VRRLALVDDAAGYAGWRLWLPPRIPHPTGGAGRCAGSGSGMAVRSGGGELVGAVSGNQRIPDGRVELSMTPRSESGSATPFHDPSEVLVRPHHQPATAQL
jgi:hypothetical protein